MGGFLKYFKDKFKQRGYSEDSKESLKTQENIPRRNSKEIIEERTGDEHVYIKFPGENLIESSLKGTNQRGSVKMDIEKVEALLSERKKNIYSWLHTHPDDFGGAFPSYKDLNCFLKHDRIRTMLIAQQDNKTGKVEGYFCLRKTRKTKPFKSNHKVNSDVSEDIFEGIEGYDIGANRGEFLSGLAYLAKRNNLQFRFIPAKGYVLDRRIDQNKFTKKENLEGKIILSISILSFIGSLAFLSFNLTGHSVANFSKSGLGLTGIVLFFLSVFLMFYYFKKRKSRLLLRKKFLPSLGEEGFR